MPVRILLFFRNRLKILKVTLTVAVEADTVTTTAMVAVEVGIDTAMIAMVEAEVEAMTDDAVARHPLVVTRIVIAAVLHLPVAAALHHPPLATVTRALLLPVVLTIGI